MGRDDHLRALPRVGMRGEAKRVDDLICGQAHGSLMPHVKGESHIGAAEFAAGNFALGLPRDMLFV